MNNVDNQKSMDLGAVKEQIHAYTKILKSKHGVC
jgi:hypothetical protein